MIHLLPYWDFNENQIIDVKAYSNAPSVELFFNGKSLGKQEIDHKHGKVLEGHWKLAYKPGTIRAVAYDEAGNVVAEDTKTSFEDPAKIVLSYEREDNLIFVDISTCDKNGVPVENARNRINVAVEGGELLGLDNGDSTDYEQYKCNSRKLFNNHLLAIVRLPSGVCATDSTGEKCAETVTSERSSSTVRFTAVSKGLEPAVLTIGGDDNTQADCKGVSSFAKTSTKIASCAIKPDDEVPVRKIELTVIDAPKVNCAVVNCAEGADSVIENYAEAEAALALSAESPSVTIKARILPENATFRALEWKPCRIEGVKTSCAKVEVSADGLTARLSAAGDGNFRLRCTASNGKPHPDIVSELEFSISGMGSGTLNPYQLISACEYSAALHEPKQSFQGGVYVPAERNWLLFENLDFGADGSDEFSIPIFSFEASLPLELWEGNPDDGGKKLMAFEYSAASWYNHYQANTWKLPRRLTGIHSLSILSTTRFSIQGIQFVESPKAFAKLFAADADRITGDSFQKQEDCITGIGNNVSLEFGSMDFGTEGTNRIVIEGRAINGTNTVHIKFTPIEADAGTKTGGEIPENQGETHTCIAEIPATAELSEHTVSLGECIKGKQNVTFVFLPGSCFDFKSFKFER
jgi:beta-galactosidase